MFLARLAVAGVAVLFTSGLVSTEAKSADIYRKAVETSENVLNKKYSKKKVVEISLGGGGIMNQSYQQSYMFGATLNYFTSEVWGFGIEGGMFFNSDKTERTCIENFYNDFDGLVEGATGRVCNTTGDDAAAQADLATSSGGQRPANMGPAYVPIREKNFFIGGHAIWNPIYGKQLFLLSATGYFDVFLKAGGGVMMGEYYAQTNLMRNGVPSRASAVEAGSSATPGTPAGGQFAGLYGIEGRPDVQSETNFYVMLGLGQKLHFARKFHVSMEVKNYTLLFTADTGFDNFVTISGNIGMRF